jgi:hypothetical protein
VKLQWLEPDTARASVVANGVDLDLRLTIAYPTFRLETDCFQRDQCALGLMLCSIRRAVQSGDERICGHLSRAFAPGEFVSVGDDIGRVTECGNVVD